MSAFSVHGLTVRIARQTLVRDVSFSLGDGVTMLLGRNGCGKSTLLRAMLCLLPSTGEICFDGQDFRAMSVRERARAVAYVPQHQALPPSTTALDYVALGDFPNRNPFSTPNVAARTRAQALLDEAALAHLANHSMETLSGGEARLLALVRARMQASRRLLLDEPLAGLDFFRQHELLDQLRRSAVPVLMSLHDPQLAWQYADHILLMDHGQVILQCDSSDETAFAAALQSLYGSSLRFETVGERRLPVWHAPKKGF